VRVVGIDLAWSPRNLSGGVVLSGGGRVLRATGELGDDDEIIDFVVQAVPRGSPGLVAIDAPLAVPNETGGRPCERQVAAVFSRFEAAPYPVNRRVLDRYGGLRGERLAQKLRELGFPHDPYIPRQADVRSLIEVFPHPATVSLFDLPKTLKYKARRGRDYPRRWSELERLRHLLAGLETASPALYAGDVLGAMAIECLRGRAFKEAEDLLDATVCAYSGLYAWHHGPRGYAVYGGPGGSDRPEDLDAEERGHILVPMTPKMWSRIKRPRILFLDRDGTLNAGVGSGPPNHPHEVELLPGVADRLWRYAALGWRLVVVTNQGGIAFGYLSEDQAWAVHREVSNRLPVDVDSTWLCPHHPRGTIARYAVDCPNRKPAPGALLEAMARYGVEAQDCLMVGDMDSDRAAAEAAGIPFAWAEDFFQGSGPAHRGAPNPKASHRQE
jgi:histidinol-phosphate phosphatase family protein